MSWITGITGIDIAEIDARTAAMAKGGHWHDFCEEVRDALVAVILASWEVDATRSARIQRRQTQQRDVVVARLRKDAVTRRWVQWGSEYFWPCRPLYIEKAESLWRAASLDIRCDSKGFRRHDPTAALRCWAVISLAAEMVRDTLAIYELSAAINKHSAVNHQEPACADLDRQLAALTTSALTLAATCSELSETPGWMPAADAGHSVAVRLATEPSLVIDWQTLLDQHKKLSSSALKVINLAAKLSESSDEAT